MSLQTRLSALISAIGADVKTLREFARYKGAWVDGAYSKGDMVRRYQTLYLASANLTAGHTAPGVTGSSWTPIGGPSNDTHETYSMRPFAFLGDVDQAKWLAALGNFGFTFMSDSDDATDLGYVASFSLFGRTWKSKVAFTPTGQIRAASDVWVGNTGTHKLTAKQDQATIDQHNASIAAQGPGFAADTYLTGSDISIPQGKIKAGTKYRLRFNVVKTGAGLVAPVITIRVGTAGSTADTARATLTFAAQTAVADEGWFEVECVFRASGAAAVIQAVGNLFHRLVTTGLNVTGVFTSVLNTGAAFDVTGANLKIGASVNGGTNAAWTVSLVAASLENLTA